MRRRLGLRGINAVIRSVEEDECAFQVSRRTAALQDEGSRISKVLLDAVRRIEKL